MLLISGGVLGAIPLSGVVSPFLSSGNTAMLANFIIFALFWPSRIRAKRAVYRRAVPRARCALEWVLGAAAAAPLRRLLPGLPRPRLLARDTHVFEDDGVKRPQHNPRLNSLAHEIQRGDIFDRNGILLATSNWKEWKSAATDYAKLDVSIDQACSRWTPAIIRSARRRPSSGRLAHRRNFHATNTSLIEHDSNTKLQGFTDYRELAPLIRYRHQPGNPDMRS